METSIDDSGMKPIEALAGVPVLVIGDAMVDHYLDGTVERISPEAPTPILSWRGEWRVAGGSANVAANIAALGGRASLIAVTGNDPAADELGQAVTAAGIDQAVLLADPARPTTVKTRLTAGHRQLLRIDRETTAPLSQVLADRLCAAFDRLADHHRGVILSDYAKGCLTPEVLAHVLAGARRRGLPVIVDPKQSDFTLYRGASIIVPNRRELTAATGRPCTTPAEAEQAAAQAIAATGAAVLLTRSEDGMSLYRAGMAARHLPTAAVDVADVTGAGDTVTATLGLAIAAGLPLDDAIDLANRAAGVVVTRFGTSVITAEALGRALGPAIPPGACLPLATAVAARRRWAAEGLTVGFTNGCFDLLHPGHLHLLRAAAASCDRLIVGLNSDASVARLKGPGRPVQDQAARATMLGGFAVVDLVVIFDEDTPLTVIEALTPDVLIKGADYRPDQVVGADLVTARGGRLLLVPLVAGQSTTGLINKGTGGL